jgi:hypothetical protein
LRYCRPFLICWGTDEPLYDIGPTPFGDGMVDDIRIYPLALTAEEIKKMLR